MPRHIGIVGVSSEGAALCFRTICAEGAGLLGAAHAHPEVSLHTQSLAAYVDCLERADDAGVAALMLASAGALERAGADFIICPDNTVHRALHLMRDRLPLPWLDIAEVTAAEAARRGARKVAVLGTRWLAGSAVYPDALSARGIGWLCPDPAEQAAIDRIIMHELVPGAVTRARAGTLHDSLHDTLRGIVERMRQAGCDAAALACTELPLILDERSLGMPALELDPAAGPRGTAARHCRLKLRRPSAVMPPRGHAAAGWRTA